MRQADNGHEFTNRFPNSNQGLLSLFEVAAAKLRSIQHKLIHPYTPRHNGKVERGHQGDKTRFYTCHSYYPLVNPSNQPAVHNHRRNSFPHGAYELVFPFNAHCPIARTALSIIDIQPSSVFWLSRACFNVCEIGSYGGLPSWRMLPTFSRIILPVSR